jgi:hypothetical protein
MASAPQFGESEGCVVGIQIFCGVFFLFFFLFFFSRLRRGSSLRCDLMKKNEKIKKI